MRYLQYIHPNVTSDPKALSSVRHLADQVVRVLKNTDFIKISHAKHTEQIEFEFKMFQTDPNIPDVNLDEGITVFWNSVGNILNIQGENIYRNLASFSKPCLVLSVANVQPERGFSENKQLLEGRALLDENTIEALRLIKHEINLYNVPGTYMPITPQMLKCFKNAHAKYKESEQAKTDLRARQVKEAEKEVLEQKKMSELNAIETKLVELKKQRVYAKDMTKEGQELLNKAIDGKMEEKMLLRAQALINGGLKQESELDLKIAEEEKKLKTLMKKTYKM